MLHELEQLQDKWGGHSATIDHWLRARQQLLIQYCELIGLRQSAPCLPEQHQITEFCNLLMDYVSAGHFEVYDILVSDDSHGTALKHEVYPQLARITDEALAFNDAFATELQAAASSRFDQQLAALGETLEDRFALEDRLINHMLEQHGAQSIQQAQEAKTD